MNLFRKWGTKEGSAKPAPAAEPAAPGPQGVVREFPSSSVSISGPGVQDAHSALREFSILLHNKRLYHHSHPKNLDSLNQAYENLQRLAQNMNGLEIRVERDAIVVPKLNEAPVPDPKNELRHLALDLQLAGVQTLVILRQFHVGELDTLAQLLR